MLASGYFQALQVFLRPFQVEILAPLSHGEGLGHFPSLHLELSCEALRGGLGAPRRQDSPQTQRRALSVGLIVALGGQ